MADYISTSTTPAAAAAEAQQTIFTQKGKGSLIDLETFVAHDIFLSHSGVQKDFVKELYSALSPNFSTFFDITDHSLPPGDHFPSRIFLEAESCKLALVVLSDQFLTSKWPMLELSTIVDAMAASRGVKLLPLFFKLSPSDLKHEANLQRWRNSWRGYALQDVNTQHPIDVSKWEQALKTLHSISGLLFDEASEGEQAYIDRIVAAVFKIIPPALKFSTTYIAGKDRLCKVILDKFKRMEQYHSSGAMLSSMESMSSSSQCKVTSVLGLYGLPGSGKSTLCRCLLDHFQPSFGTKTHYLEFSSTSSQADVVNELKGLLRLTDFRDRINLDRVTLNIEQLEYLLTSYRLSSCRVFLVVDNISDKSWEAVHRILHLGFGLGSKIILVAHTLNVLCTTLDSLKDGLHWACDSMAVPSIDDMEAMEILLWTARGSRATSDKYTLFKNFTPTQLRIVKRIVHMCSYYDLEGGQMRLPLVMRAVGARLLKYIGNGDLKGWENDLESFWTRVKAYEQSVLVEKLLGENFNTLLKEDLQLLFLDVSFFILHFEKGSGALIATVSEMHGLSTVRMIMKMQDLERHGFLTVSKDGILRVHDVYLEFAKSIHDGPSKYMTNSRISWCWKYHQILGTKVVGSRVLLKDNQSPEDEFKLRALVLEVGEGCERVDLQGFSGLKAVGLRSCKSLAVLGLAGLSSLVTLDFRDCPNFKQLDCSDSDHASLLNVRSLNLIGLTQYEVKEQAAVSYLQSIFHNMKKLFAPFRPPKSFELELTGACQMRSLQFLRLEDTGIRRLEGVGRLWPQLQYLVVIERHLEKLELGFLPNLKQLVISLGPNLIYESDSFSPMDVYETSELSETWGYEEGNGRYDLLPREGLLMGCPQLKVVMVDFKHKQFGNNLHQLGSLPGGLVALRLFDFHAIGLYQVPDLSLTVHTLLHLDFKGSKDLERINLDIGFTSLRTLCLYFCDNLMEVIGLGSLPSLRVLYIAGCDKIQSLKGFENSAMLENLHLEGLMNLREISCISSLMNLHTLKIQGCPKLGTFIAKARLCDMRNLRECSIEISGECCFSLSNCKNLERLEMDYIVGQLGDCSTDDSPGALFKLEHLDKLENLGHLWISGRGQIPKENDHVKPKLGFSSMVRFGGGVFSVDLSMMKCSDTRLRLSRISCLDYSVRFLHLGGCDVLDNMDGIGHLMGKLEECELWALNNLRSLRGIEALIHLRFLDVGECPVLEEMPSLHALVHMQELRVTECPKLKAFEGHCDHMTQLRCAVFNGCESMESLPFKDFSALQKSNMDELFISFHGCEVMRSKVEYMAAWAVEEVAPAGLRLESLRVVVRLYYSCINMMGGEKERVAEALFLCMVRLLQPSLSDHSACTPLDFSRFERAFQRARVVSTPGLQEFESAAVMEALQELRRSVDGQSRQLLLQQQSLTQYTPSLTQFLDHLNFPHAESVFTDLF